jgi:hypothetical protein
MSPKLSVMRALRLVLVAIFLAGWTRGAEVPAFSLESISYRGMTGNYLLAPGEKPPDPGRCVAFGLKLQDALAARAFAARVVIDFAEDDTGAHLKQNSGARFFTESVGRVNGDDAMVTSRQPLDFAVEGVTKAAKSLRRVEGFVELVVPDNDPNATVVVEKISTRYGAPLEFPALAQAGVKLVLIGPGGIDSNVQRAGEEGRKFGMALPPDFGRVGANEVGVSVVDPEERIVRMEFQTATGGTLRYNHNGQGHFGYPGGNFHTYGIDEKAATEARFVCWLLTKKSLVRHPLRLADVALPPPP